ncbi:DUF853 family protein [Pseudolactococcus yaeyamensis]
MKFDTITASEDLKKSKRKTNRFSRLLRNNRQKQGNLEEVYPVKNIDDDGMMLLSVKNDLGQSFEEYSYYISVEPYDLTNIAPNELAEIQKQYATLQRTFRTSMKEIYLSFPEDNLKQQAHIKNLIEKTHDNFKLAFLQKELGKLKYLEETHISQKSFIQIFAPTPEKLNRRWQDFQDSANKLFKPTLLGRDNSLTILSLLNNGFEGLKRTTDLIEGTSDDSLLQLTNPLGGLYFSYSPTSYIQGAKHRATITIEALPTKLLTYWVSNLSARKAVDTVGIDYNFDANYKAISAIDSTIADYQKQAKKTTNQTTLDFFAHQRLLLGQLGQEILNNGEIIKDVKIKLHLSAFSEEALGLKIQSTTNELLEKGYTPTVILNNSKRDYQSLFISYAMQYSTDQVSVIGRKRLPAAAIAEGFSHNNISLNDEQGFVLGRSATGGLLYFDPFTKSKDRLSYSLFISGFLGSGKSTFLKKQMLNNFIRGGLTFSWDVNGEQKKLADKLHGSYVRLDGSDGIINMLQVFALKTFERDDSIEIDIEGSFNTHLDAVVSRLKSVGVFDQKMTRGIRGALLKFYIHYDAVYDFNAYHARGQKIVDVTAFENTAYPTFDDLYDYLHPIVTSSSSDILEDDLAAFKELYSIVRDLINQYRQAFVGHTTLDKLVDNKLVIFDITRLKDSGVNVNDAIFHMSLSLVTSLAIRHGQIEKLAYESGQKKWWEIERVFIAVDECHNVVRPEKFYNVSAFAVLQREARKFFISLALATQLIETMFPTDLVMHDEAALAMNEMRSIVGLAQYKIFGKQSETSIPTLEKYFSTYLNPRDYKEMLEYETTKKGSKMKMIISGGRAFNFLHQVSPEELAMFSGGA